MPQVETLRPLSVIEKRSPNEDMHVFNVSLYRNLFNQGVQAGLSAEQAKGVVAFAATNDSLGAITENISGEKDRFGNFIFNVEDRIRMQLTPPRHFYLEFEDEITGEPVMVAPEHKWGIFKKDVLSLISNWRRGMDKVGMAGVRARFLDKSENGLKEGQTIFWGSPKAEEWEGENIIKYNGQYGFLYVGRVININGFRVLEVHDFKNDLSAASYEFFFRSLDGEVSTNPAYSDHLLADKVKASYVVTNQNWTTEAIWGRLCDVQGQLIGQAEIFNLSVNTILALQDFNVQGRIRKDVAAPVGKWIADEIYRGTPIDEIQSQVRQKFIDMTLALLTQLKTERGLQTWLSIEQNRNTIAIAAVYVNPTDQTVLNRYSGSGGIGCGSWGGSSGGFGGGAVSSVIGLSSAFESDEHGSLYFQCPHADCKRTNKRDKGVLRETCQHCGKVIPRC